ncbi:MAG: hypothetical protein R3Y43_05060 [Alphaproteobacteria bacterium]
MSDIKKTLLKSKMKAKIQTASLEELAVMRAEFRELDQGSEAVEFDREIDKALKSTINKNDQTLWSEKALGFSSSSFDVKNIDAIQEFTNRFGYNNGESFNPMVGTKSVCDKLNKSYESLKENAPDEYVLTTRGKVEKIIAEEAEKEAKTSGISGMFDNLKKTPETRGTSDDAGVNKMAQMIQTKMAELKGR